MRREKQLARMTDLHNNTGRNGDTPSNGLGVELDALEKSHALLLLGGQLRIMLEHLDRLSGLEVLGGDGGGDISLDVGHGC